MDLTEHLTSENKYSIPISCSEIYTNFIKKEEIDLDNDQLDFKNEYLNFDDPFISNSWEKNDFKAYIKSEYIPEECKTEDQEFLSETNSWSEFETLSENEDIKQFKPSENVLQLEERKELQNVRTDVSEKQIWTLIAENEKAKRECRAMSWVEVSDILNSIGPVIRNAKLWRTWFSTYKDNLRKRKDDGAILTELEEKVASFVGKKINCGEKQLSMIIAEKSRAEKDNENICWHKMAKVLNAEGPIIKSSYKWRQWFSSFLQTKRKQSAQVKREKCRSNKMDITNDNKKQLSILIREQAKPKNEKLAWAAISKILNDEGPMVKNTHAWKQYFYNYTSSLIRKLNCGEKLTQLEEQQLRPPRKKNMVSEEQISTLIEEIEKSPKPSWHHVSEVLNAKGPAIKIFSTWKMWFYEYKIRIRKKISNGSELTQLEKKVIAYEKRKRK